MSWYLEGLDIDYCRYHLSRAPSPTWPKTRIPRNKHDTGIPRQRLCSRIRKQPIYWAIPCWLGILSFHLTSWFQAIHLSVYFDYFRLFIISHGQAEGYSPWLLLSLSLSDYLPEHTLCDNTILPHPDMADAFEVCCAWDPRREGSISFTENYQPVTETNIRQGASVKEQLIEACRRNNVELLTEIIHNCKSDEEISNLLNNTTTVMGNHLYHEAALQGNCTCRVPCPVMLPHCSHVSRPVVNQPQPPERFVTVRD